MKCENSRFMNNPAQLRLGHLLEGQEGIRLATEQVTPEVTEQVRPQVTPQVEKIICTLYGELSGRELLDLLGLKDRMYFAKEYLHPSLEANLIEMTLPDKPRSSKQKSRLTAQGKRLRNKLEIEKTNGGDLQ